MQLPFPAGVKWWKEKDFNELIKYIVLSCSAFQLKIQPDGKKKITQPNFSHLHLFSKPCCFASLMHCPPSSPVLFLLNLCKRLSFNEKVRRKRRACQIKDRSRLTALTGIYDKHWEGEGGGVGMYEGGGRVRVDVVVVVVGLVVGGGVHCWKLHAVIADGVRCGMSL